ncbi:MAG TPA: hypothetical protein VN282_24920 [Pyrinomonadaceae bacterium]|nr:hypothetical protein [Pyrinomonadaceae bacterium]
MSATLKKITRLISSRGEMLARLVLSLVCFTAYISLFVAVVTSAFDTSLSRPLLG